MNLRKSSILMLLFLLPFVVHAQDAVEQEIRKIRAFYSAKEIKHVKGQMNLMESGKLLDKVDFEYWVKEGNFYSKMNELEILSTSKVYIAVNHKYKSILYREGDKIKGKRQAPSIDLDNFFSLLKGQGGKISLLKGDKLNTIHLTNVVDSRFSKVSIIYSNTDFSIKRIEAFVKPFGANGEQKLLIEYENRTAGQMDEKAIFSDAKFIQSRKGKNVSFTNKFQQYKKI